MKVSQFSGDGTQDPIDWSRSFTKAVQVNDWKEEKLARMITAHMIDEAEEWWDDYYDTNKTTANAMLWENIIKEFLKKYATERWPNHW